MDGLVRGRSEHVGVTPLMVLDWRNEVPSSSVDVVELSEATEAVVEPWTVGLGCKEDDGRLVLLPSRTSCESPPI